MTNLLERRPSRIATPLLLLGGSIAFLGTRASGQVPAPTPEAHATSAHMAADAHPSFEVATIRPSDPRESGDGFHTEAHRFTIKEETVDEMICFAYRLQASQVVNGPAWFSADRYTVDGVPDVPGEPNVQQMQEMLQKLLAERFKLIFHAEKREISVYAVTVAKGGPRMAKGDSAEGLDENGSGHGLLREMKVTNSSMADFAMLMEYFLDRPVVDRTGLAGVYNFVLTWTPDALRASEPNAGPSIFTAIQEQLGLKMEPKKDLADVLVIDHAQRPSEN